MTFCVGMRVDSGLVGIADTRVTSGSECIVARKLSVYEGPGWSMFFMTSGLRSVRDKAVTYFDDAVSTLDGQITRLYELVNLLARQVRRVSEEDRAALAKSDLRFDIHVLVGGQMEGDSAHRLYQIYPEGNWVEVGEGTPYHIIGASGYGKPVLDRTLTHADPLRFALKVGILAFDSTRISAADVDFPVDVVMYVKDSFRLITHRYEKEELHEISVWWQEQLRQTVRDLSLTPLQPLLEQLPAPAAASRSLTS
ncbi:MAG: peptidase [Planctomycetota bacterium]